MLHISVCICLTDSVSDDIMALLKSWDGGIWRRDPAALLLLQAAADLIYGPIGSFTDEVVVGDILRSLRNQTIVYTQVCQ